MQFPKTKLIDLPSGEASFLEAGSASGEVVLLLHGGGLDCASLSWRRLIPELVSDYRIVAPNWPGYGETAPFGRPYKIDDIGAWLIEFLDHMKIESASIIGVSMGAGASLWCAIHHPDRVKALVPVGTYGVASKAPYHLLSFLLTKLPLNAISYGFMRRSPKMLRRALASIFADPNQITDEVLSEVAGVLANAGAGEAFTNFQRGEMTATGLRTDLSTQMRDIRQPTLFIHGREDSLVPLSSVERAASSMPNARVQIMDAGHWPMRERPDEFNKLAHRFLKSAASQ
ncbi:alpha/beta hydrolase [Gymnodinialimonas sp. 2305UL16-5]|uniref:alpha/beta fold hydrolase n=1 Tax=Gymnodinialimonas mytili TaxID=3126503 RepID=UPI0030A60027